MAATTTWFQTTAIDYPNSRPHIGTAFEKLGADVQARYRRMEGCDVFFLMGNDENTVKVSKRAAELGLDTQAYCDDMARQFQEVWKALDISYDTFVQTSSERHKQCCRKFIQKVYDNGYIYKGEYGGWYCDGCEEFKSEKVHTEHAGNCPVHKRPLIRRSEPCWFFKLSAFQERLLKHLKENPEFVQPESRRNEMIGFIEAEGLQDLNISRTGEEWGIRLPFDLDFTVYVWFDALLTYVTGIGYGDDEATFRKYWPADVHFIGKDITRFHTHIWPAMLWAAGEEAPKRVFSHGFVYLKLPEGKLEEKGEATGLVKIGKSTLKELGLEYLAEPMEIIKKFSSESFRYYFLRECPFPSDGEFSPERFVEVYNSELANNLGNLFSREMTITWKNFEGVFAGTAGKVPETVVPGLNLAEFVATVRGHVEGCRYNQALQAIVQEFLTPTNQYLEANAPWKLVKTDKDAAKRVLFNAVQSLRVASILLKPFIPKSAEAIYTSFNFPKPWAEVTYADAAELLAQPDDLRVTAELVEGKVKPLFPRIG
ncbi:methionine--tRNA ligase [Gemmata sp.]|uniref:methionine--tRNA ligase n=1 Tax=Gemmata sp. TaxID=1914242 RepID=UPI003F6F6054